MNAIQVFWTQFVYNSLYNFLGFLSHLLANNLGAGIIALTILIRLVLLPLNLPTIRYSRKMALLKPQLDELKKRIGDDKKKLLEEQNKLFKEHGVNPLAGCLPTILQIAVFFTLYRVFINGLHVTNVSSIFLIWDVTKPDHFFILPVLAGLSQLVSSLMLLPAIEHHPGQVKEEKKESVEDMASTMQSQMLFLMPVMTTMIAVALPSGLSLYWVITTLFQIVQQYYTSGWGGLRIWLKRIPRLRK